jgi:hypothetical protein
LFGEGLEEAAPRGEGLSATVAAEACLGLQPDEGAKVRLDPPCVARVGEHVCDRGSELLCRLRLGVPLEDPRLRLDDLRDRPKSDSVAVREAPPLPPGDQVRVVVGDAGELVHEPALSHPWYADEGDELRDPLVAGAIERVDQDGELPLAPHELRIHMVHNVHSEARCCLDGLPDRDRRRLPLRLHGGELAVRDHVPGCPVRRPSHEDAVHGSGRLEASRGVDHVARGHPLTLRRACAERDERLAGGDADSQLRALGAREVADREGCPDGALRIVLVGDGCTEQGHDRVPDELLHRPAVPLELNADLGLVARQERANVLRIQALRSRGRPDEVAEEDGDDLALLAHFSRGSQRDTAHAAQAKAIWVLLAAARTYDRHGHRVRRASPRR